MDVVHLLKESSLIAMGIHHVYAFDFWLFCFFKKIILKILVCLTKKRRSVIDCELWMQWASSKRHAHRRHSNNLLKWKHINCIVLYLFWIRIFRMFCQGLIPPSSPKSRPRVQVSNQNINIYWRKWFTLC